MNGVAEVTTNYVWDTLYATDACLCENVDECNDVGGGGFDTMGLAACGAQERCLDHTPTALDDTEPGAFSVWQRLYVCENCGAN